jgi:hypothetical protein
MAAVGTFVLYLFGYLSLRFKLTVLGVGTDLYFLDERYLFEGVRFLVYIIAIVPNLLLTALLIAGPFYLLHRLKSWVWCGWPMGRLSEQMRRFWNWWRQPPRLTLFGIIFSLLVIQILMRKGFQLSNILVKDQLAQEAWVNCVLLNESWRELYFHGLVAAAVLTGSCLFTGGTLAGQNGWSRAAGSLLVFLFAVQVLLLPINYGVLVSTGGLSVPRVSSLNGVAPLAESTVAWLVWEGRDGFTYLVKGSAEGRERRALVTLPKAKVERTEIVAYDSLMKQLFEASSGCTSRDTLLTEGQQ